MEHRRLFVYETQRHEFSDSSSTFLNITEDIEMSRLVTRRFNVAVHDSRGGRNPYLMGGLDQVNPLGGADSARRNLVTYFVHQHLCGSSGETANAGFLEGKQIVANRNATERGSVQNLFRRKPVDMQSRKCFLQRSTEIDVVPAVDTGSETRLDADLGGTQLAGFGCAPDDFLGRQEVTFFGQVTPAESAETTSFDTHIGEVDIAINDIGNDVAHGRGAQIISSSHQCRQVGTIGVKETGCLIDRNV